MIKINKSKTVLLSVVGSALAVVALLIFMLLPTSQLANGIEYSGQDALWVLTVAPVASIIGSICCIIAFIKDCKVWEKNLTDGIIISITGLITGFGLLNFVTYLLYTIQQFSLGFVAPYENTVYEFLAVAAVASTLIHVFFTAFTVIAVSRNNKM